MNGFSCILSYILRYLVSKITQMKRKILFQKLLKNQYLILSLLVFATLGLYLPSYAQVKNFIQVHGDFTDGSGLKVLYDILAKKHTV